MATLNSTLSGTTTGDTLIGTQAAQLVSGGDGGDSIGSKYTKSCLVGAGGADTFYTNKTVSGVGTGSTLEGGSGSDSFGFGTAVVPSSNTFDPC